MYCVYLRNTLLRMIKSIKHKGISLLATKNDASKLNQNLVRKIKQVLVLLNNINEVPKDLELYKHLRPHPYKGVKDNIWSLDISGNWRIIFEFKDGHVYNVDMIDPH